MDQDFLNNEKKLTYIIDIDGKEVEKELNLELERFKYTDKDLDFTIIEIIEKDDINNYLELDKYINSKDYKNEHIFSVQFPGGQNIKISPGKIICKKRLLFFLYFRDRRTVFWFANYINRKLKNYCTT